MSVCPWWSLCVYNTSCSGLHILQDFSLAVMRRNSTRKSFMQPHIPDTTVLYPLRLVSILMHCSACALSMLCILKHPTCTLSNNKTNKQLHVDEHYAL